MWYCRHLSSLLVEGQALWCSLASTPVSADYRRLVERICSSERLRCQPKCVYHDSGDTPPFSEVPNEVITVPQTRVTLTFDPCPSLCRNVNNSSRHLCCGGSPLPVRLSLIGGWHAELSRKWPACMEIKVGSCLLMRQTYSVANVPAFVRQAPAAACQPPC